MTIKQRKAIAKRKRERRKEQLEAAQALGYKVNIFSNSKLWRSRYGKYKRAVEANAKKYGADHELLDPYDFRRAWLQHHVEGTKNIKQALINEVTKPISREQAKGIRQALLENFKKDKNYKAPTQAQIRAGGIQSLIDSYELKTEDGRVINIYNTIVYDRNNNEITDPVRKFAALFYRQNKDKLKASGETMSGYIFGSP